MADRLANEAGLIDNVVRNGLDEVNALQFKNHPETFTFAMALGAGEGERKATIKRSAWLQYSAIRNSDSENLSYATSLALSELRKVKQDNLISNEDDIFDIVSEYANSGFEIIQDMVDFDDYDEDDFVMQLVALMDDKYDAITAETEG